MIIHKLGTSILLTTLAFGIVSFNINANDCALYSDPNKAVKCLTKKVSKLEKKLKKQAKTELNLPTGAIIDFAGQACPDGWGEFKQSNSKAAASQVESRIIKCQKQ